MIRDFLALLAKLFRGPRNPEDGWAGLMEAYQRMEQQLQQRIERLENEVVSLVAALERERIEHAECRRRLASLEHRVDELTRRQDGGS